MKKSIVIAIVIALLSFPGLAQAAEAISEDGTYVGEAATLDAGRALNTSFDGYSTVTFLANGHKDGVTTNVSTASHLTSAALAYGVINLVGSSTAIKYISIANGVKGQMVTLMLYPRQGYNVVIGAYAAAGSLTKTGWSTITLDSSCDTITLLWLNDTAGWIIVGNNGSTVATVLYPG